MASRHPNGSLDDWVRTLELLGAEITLDNFPNGRQVSLTRRGRRFRAEGPTYVNACERLYEQITAAEPPE
jgi:hypothetical protein